MQKRKKGYLKYDPQIYQFYLTHVHKNINELKFKNNEIDTKKYNIITFLPKSLLFQFMRLANVYFLIIAIIQCISIISPLNPVSAIAPLIIVLSVSLIREGIEDYQRGKLDKEQNSEAVEVFREGKWINTVSGNIIIGEIVSVRKNGTFPADLCLIDSSLNGGICFIETGTLDGEKTLKIKESPNFTKGKFNLDEISHNFNIGGNNNFNISENDSINGNFGKNNKRIKGKKNGDNISVDNSKTTNEPPNNKKNNNNNNNNNNGGNKEEEIKDLNVRNRLSYFYVEGFCRCDLPNPALYSLNGKMNFRLNGEVKEFPLDAKNLLLKGAKLRNTEWIIGVVIYTGHNCKIMKNSKEGLVKYSTVEKLMNKLLYFILGFQIFLSIISAIIHDKYYKNKKNAILQKKNILEVPLNRRNNNYIDFMKLSLNVDSTISFFTYFLLLNTLIPISLVVTLEIVKIIQGLFILVDVEGYSFVRKKFIKPNSVSLNEELGMVNYIFTDKTGTLTSNKMLLKFVVIGDTCYEFIRDDDYIINKDLRKREDIIPFEKYEMINASNNKNGNTGIFDVLSYKNYFVKSFDNPKISIQFDKTEKLIEEFWKALSLCHDCNFQNGEYIGMSPDNLELVKSAALQGFQFDYSENSDELILNIGDLRGAKKKVFQKLKKIDFSSDRKRESIILKDGNLIKLYCKGADSIIEERLLNSSFPKEVLQKNKYFVNFFSAKGYRTLYIAMRILTQKEYDNFIKNVEEAELDTDRKDERLEEIYNSIESNLTLLGTTIVEDKLQENVPETIEDLRTAGIKIWMLTGDKLNTAYNIALSCNLIDKHMKMFILQGKEKIKNERLEDINKEERENIILDFAKKYKKFKGEYRSMSRKIIFGILVDEKALLTISENLEIEKIFLNIAKYAVAVICCRVSPLQKSQVVKMMKNHEKKKITLAIGDGGNDVSMIMEAHIGVGIYGEEGLRAAQSSDYAIGEFKILRRLLLYHGHNSLIRNSEMIIYFFYKNFVFTIIHFFYGFLNDFSGQTIIDDWFIMCFNLIFTSVPLAVRGVLDLGLIPEDGILIYKMQPYLYLDYRNNPRFTLFNFSMDLLKGTIQSLLNFIICINIVKSSVDNNGNLGCLWFTSVNMYTNILIIVSINLVVFTNYHTILNFTFLIFVTFFLYMIFIIAVQKLTLFNSVGTMSVAFNSLKMWLSLFLVNGSCFISELAILTYKTCFIDNVNNILKLVDDKSNSEIPYELQNYINEMNVSEDEKDSNNEEKKKKLLTVAQNPLTKISIFKKQIENERKERKIKKSKEKNYSQIEDIPSTERGLKKGKKTLKNNKISKIKKPPLLSMNVKKINEEDNKNEDNFDINNLIIQNENEEKSINDNLGIDNNINININDFVDENI